MPIEPFRKIPENLREWSQFFRDAVVDANSALTATDATTAGTATTVSGVVGIAHGGTGSSTAATARTALGLGTAAVEAIGTSGATVPKLSTANTWTVAQTFSAPPVVPTYTVAGVPSASPAGQMAFISDETGGAVLAFSDATNWRRVTDRAVIA